MSVYTTGLIYQATNEQETIVIHVQNLGSATARVGIEVYGLSEFSYQSLTTTTFQTYTLPVLQPAGQYQSTGTLTFQPPHTSVYPNYGIRMTTSGPDAEYVRGSIRYFSERGALLKIIFTDSMKKHTSPVHMYMTDPSVDHIFTYDAVTHSLAHTIKSSPTVDLCCPSAIFIHPNGNRAYLGQASIKGVAVIDTQSKKVIRTLSNVGIVIGFAAHPTNENVYVLDQAGFVHVLDSKSDEFQGEPIAVGPLPTAMSITSDGHLVYVTNRLTSIVYVIHTMIHTVVERHSLPAVPNSMAIHPKNDDVYIAHDQTSVLSVLQVGTYTNITNIALPEGDQPEQIAISPDGSFIYVLNNKDTPNVRMFHSNHPMIITTIEDANAFPNGCKLQAICFTPDQKSAYVSVSNDTIVVIDVIHHRIDQIFSVPVAPQHITANPLVLGCTHFV